MTERENSQLPNLDKSNVHCPTLQSGIRVELSRYLWSE